jgi:membrane protein required for colicin V production
MIDLIFILFSIVFVVTAFLRGFVKEVFSLLNWAISLMITYYFSPIIAPLFYSYASSTLIIDLVVKTILFIFTFIAFAFLTSTIAKIAQDKIPVSIDKSLGVFFGMIKTLIIFGIIYSVILNLYVNLADKSKEEASIKAPDFLTNAKSYNIIRYSGEIIDPIVESFFLSTTKDIMQGNVLNEFIKENKIDQNIVKEIENSKDKINNIRQNKDNNISDSDIKNLKNNIGYDKNDIQKMNRLIDIIEKVKP